jgi:hypothetical protein
MINVWAGFYGDESVDENGAIDGVYESPKALRRRYESDGAYVQKIRGSSDEPFLFHIVYDRGGEEEDPDAMSFYVYMVEVEFHHMQTQCEQCNGSGTTMRDDPRGWLFGVVKDTCDLCEGTGKQ